MGELDVGLSGWDLGPTEHDAQVQLAGLWGRGAFTLGGHQMCLLGWEMMPPDWEVNDSRAIWNRPSIDFLAVNSDGELAAIELKMRPGGPVSQARSCAQVTALALALSASATSDKVQRAYLAARGGVLGRQGLGASDDAFDHASAALGVAVGPGVLSRPVRRIVAVVRQGSRPYQEVWTDTDIDSVLAQSVATNSLRMRRRLQAARSLPNATVVSQCEVYVVSNGHA